MSVRVDLPPDHPHVAVVTIDRPDAANALDPPTLRGLAAAWRRIAADADIRCAVLTGAGDRVFCAGMDMKTTIPAAQRLARGERLDEDTFAALRDVATATLVDFDLGVPLVCAVNGHARAGGFDLMLASEIRFAVPHATFALGGGRARALPDRSRHRAAAAPDPLGARAGAAAHRAPDRRRPGRARSAC